jgi:uncharacterized flavoprotein (TIGR03862 family)
MAADILSQGGLHVRIYERRPAAGWKLLVAGSSGPNVSYDCAPEELPSYYSRRREEMASCLRRFTREDWLSCLTGLGEEVFLGTSRRYFIRNRKASVLLRSWMERLQERGVEFYFNEEFSGFSAAGKVRTFFSSGKKETSGSLLLALGGGSWETEPPSWPGALKRKGLCVSDLSPANAGYSILAPDAFFSAAQGKPIKGLRLTTAKGTKLGECMITRYGLEGTPVYTVGCPGAATLDLKPDLPLAQLREKLQRHSLQGRLKAAKLSEGARLLFLALAPEAPKLSAEKTAELLKCLPVEFLAPRPLAESISSAGGLSWDELDDELQLKKFPSVYCAGEMLDWDAPTGGFLLQGCVSMGAVAALAILRRNGHALASLASG